MHDVDGTTSTQKVVKFEHLTIKDTRYDTMNDIITFGPLYTEEDVNIHMNDALFENLNFTTFAHLLHLKHQTKDPFVLENSVFQDIIGGNILVEPLTVSDDTLKSTLLMKNLTVYNNDFGDSTFITLKEH